MSKEQKAKERLSKRKLRIRSKISGSHQRPRLTVFVSNKYMYVQAIDDVTGTTICSGSTLNKDISSKISSSSRSNVEACSILGKEFGIKLKEKGIESVVFDRNGRRYKGKISGLANSIREAGINF